MPYDKPPITNVPFKFTSSGYTSPDFTEVPFRFGLRPSTQQTADMQATIDVFGKYCSSTYTYVKERKTYVVGYSSHGIQILKGQTIYGGIRDLCASLTRTPPYADLPAYAFALSNFMDLSAYLKSNIQAHADIAADVYGIPPLDLPAFLHGWDHSDISASVYGWAIKDLYGYIGAHPPNDLQAILNVIEIRDIPASIIGEWYHGQYDLPAEFYRIWGRGEKNLGALLAGWVELDLPAYITSVYFKDLSAIIQGSRTADLSAYIYSISPKDLQALIHGFDTRELPAYIQGSYGPYDLRANLDVISPTDLQAYINGFKGVQIPFDLQGIVEGWNTNDLPALLNLVFPADLNAYLNAVGKSADLLATIIPSTILMKRALQIPLLEHKDLAAMVNFMCFGSSYEELSASLYAIHKLDLPAFIIGWYGSTSDNLKDLGAYINTEDYITQDKTTIAYVPEVDKYSLLKLQFGIKDPYYTTWNTIDIMYGTYYAKNLSASINGVLNSSDLNASLTSVFDWNYSELPEYVKPKTHEVFINMERFETQWRRFIELMFDRTGTRPFEYFYVGGTKKVYKIDRSRSWTIWADGYSRNDDSTIERSNVRRKFVFNMSNYSTVDEAIRELIERAAYPTSSDLSAYINGGLGKHLDLSANIDILSKYK